MKAPTDYQSPRIRSKSSFRRAKTRGWRPNTRRGLLCRKLWCDVLSAGREVVDDHVTSNCRVVKYAMAAEAPHNVVEQDNRSVKRHIQPMVGFKSPRIGKFNFGPDRNSAHDPEKETRRRLTIRVLFRPCCVRGRQALSDTVLARALNWKTLLPISAQFLAKAALRDLAADGQGAELAVQVRILESIEDTVRMARDLARRAEALSAIAPKLRPKGSDAAVELFLTEDAVASTSMLSPRIWGTSISMTDRAARRFCDRLVELGGARGLTGRPSFRLYGIAP